MKNLIRTLALSVGLALTGCGNRSNELMIVGDVNRDGTNDLVYTKSDSEGEKIACKFYNQIEGLTDYKEHSLSQRIVSMALLNKDEVVINDPEGIKIWNLRENTIEPQDYHH